MGTDQGGALLVQGAVPLLAAEELRDAVTDRREQDRDAAAPFVAPAALYVHIPVCASKCAYCDFYSLPASCLAEGFELGLVRSILDRAAILSERFSASSFETLYIGGGTPSLLPAPAMDELLAGLGRLAGAEGGRGPAEWTVEANPDSLTPEALEIMSRRGVTRLSIGVQSLDPDELSLLGRRHGPEAALLALRRASEADFTVSADLIAGIPLPADSGRDFGDPRKRAAFARELLDAGARHLSAYDLSLEEGSPLAERASRLRFPTEDEDWEARLALEEVLRDAGLRRYEVSNYSAPGDECRHNLAYWRMDSYIGAGPGAVSTLARSSGSGLRIEEARLIGDYRERAAEAALETELGFRDSLFEFLMMGFRTVFGPDPETLRSRFGLELESLVGESLAAWEERLTQGEAWPGRGGAGGRALDARGLDLLNRFLVDCMLEIERRIPA
jgi:oxygen-independent coproporphyrinogen-3 oxidase